MAFSPYYGPVASLAIALTLKLDPQGLKLVCIFEDVQLFLYLFAYLVGLLFIIRYSATQH